MSVLLLDCDRLDWKIDEIVRGLDEERYNYQPPPEVAREIGEAAAALAATLESLDNGAWSRAGIYNYPERCVRTVEWIGRHTLHEGEHHLQDIDRVVGLAHLPRE